MHQNKHFELHNGIAVNPENLSVPTSLEVADWKKRTRTKSLSIDSRLSSYYSVLQRKEKKEAANVKYIRSTDF